MQFADHTLYPNSPWQVSSHLEKYLNPSRRTPIIIINTPKRFAPEVDDQMFLPSPLECL